MCIIKGYLRIPFLLNTGSGEETMINLLRGIEYSSTPMDATVEADVYAAAGTLMFSMSGQRGTVEDTVRRLPTVAYYRITSVVGPMYHSSTHGLVAISGMNDTHLCNALASKCRMAYGQLSTSRKMTSETPADYVERLLKGLLSVADDELKNLLAEYKNRAM